MAVPSRPNMQKRRDYCENAAKIKAKSAVA
jgi:hypothetical protein